MGKCAISSFIHCRRNWGQSLSQFCRCTTTSLNKCLNSQLQLQNVTNILFAIILTSKHSAVSGLHNLASNELQMENVDFKPATWTCHVWVVPTTQISKPKSDYVKVNCLSLRTTDSKPMAKLNLEFETQAWATRTFLMIHVLPMQNALHIKSSVLHEIRWCCSIPQPGIEWNSSGTHWFQSAYVDMPYPICSYSNPKTQVW